MASDEVKLSKLEMQVMRSFWKLKRATVREAHEAIPDGPEKPEYTTAQTVISRLEAKGAIHRLKKIGNAWVYQPLVSRKSVVGRLIDDLVGVLDGATSPIVSHLAESGKLSEEDIKEIEQIITKSEKRK